MTAATLQENKMGVMPVGKLIANMALPMVISMLVQALYNVVDSIYVSQVSESAVTALSLAFPIQNLLIGFAVGIGVGVNSLLSKSLGEKNQEAANRAAGNGIVLMAIAMVLFVLFGLFGVRPYFAIQSDNPETVEGGIVYTSICCVFSVGCFASILGERLLQSTGRTVHTMITQSIGAIINIILDPILIHGWFGLPAMGIAGAAIATVIGQWVSGIMVIIFNLKFNPEVQLHKKYLPLEGKTVAAILTVGIPSIVMNGIGSVMNFGINQILQGFAETATGVFGVYFKLQSFFFMPLFGLNNATISIIAYNYGARKPQQDHQNAENFLHRGAVSHDGGTVWCSSSSRICCWDCSTPLRRFWRSAGSLCAPSAGASPLRPSALRWAPAFRRWATAFTPPLFPCAVSWWYCSRWPIC